MKEILEFIKNYWAQIIFLLGVFSTFLIQIKSSREAVKCSLRNDILQIYDECKDKKEITKYQLQAVELSYVLYKKLKGNSFVDDIVAQMRTFKIID